MSIHIPRGVTHGLVSFVGTRIPRAAARFYPDVLWRVPTNSKTAYLTFDDGPNPHCTDRILEILSRHGASGTFFVLGENVESQPHLVRTIRTAGHGIGNHSYSHPDAWRSEASVVLQELDRTSRMLEDLIGERVRSMRPPYGRFTRAIREWCERRRHQLTMWDVGPGDYLEALSADDVVRQLRQHVRPGSIVVLHDNPRCSTKTPAALDRFLERFSNEGWRFPPLFDDGLEPEVAHAPKGPAL